MSRALVFTLALGAAGCFAPEWTPLDAGAPERCNYSNCRGCCLQGVCVSGYDDNACGLLGRACEACPMALECGPARSCIAPPPDAGPAYNRQYGYGGAPSGAGDASNTEQPARCQYNCR